MKIRDVEISGQVYHRLLELPKTLVIAILVQAIEEMRLNKSKDVNEAILINLGAEKTANGWKIPSSFVLVKAWKGCLDV